MSSDRRRSPRIEILTGLHGRTAAGTGPIHVREMSLGGMAVESAAPFDVGAVHAFELTLGDGSTVQLAGRVVHSRPVVDAAPPVAYLTGIQFIDEDAADDEGVIGDLLNRVR
jgi:hypothetical protein